MENVFLEDSQDEENLSSKNGKKEDSYVSKKERKEGLEKIKKISDQTEEKIEEMIRDETSLPEEELLLEEEGNFFWILQRVTWGVVKTVVIVGGVGFLLWLVWQPTKEKVFPRKEITQEEGKKEQKKEPLPRKKEKEKVAQEKVVVPNVPSEHAAKNAALWSKWLEDMRLYEISGSVSKTLSWMRKASALFDVPLYDLVRGDTREVRQGKVEMVLSEIFDLLQESVVLQKKLEEEMREFATQTQLADGQSQELYKTLRQSIQGLEPIEATTSLQEKITVQQKLVSASSELETRQLLLGLLIQYDTILREWYDNVYANQKAIIEDVQVVKFPGDPLYRILTPSEFQIQK